MNRNSKKGFTIVELIIVIAVIAVLAAVLIPTFSNLIQKANVAADQTLIKNLNTALAMDTTVSKHETMTQALEATKANGFDVEKIVARATKNRIVWDSVNDCFAYIEEGKNEPTYIPDTKANPNVADYQLWTIVNDTTLDATYSSYIAGTSVTGAVVAAKGVDVGENTGITAVTYKNETTTAQTVTIRTNGGKLTIEGDNDSVFHFGEASEVDVVKCAMRSYHEFGKVNLILLNKGHVVVNDGAEVSQITIPETVNVNEVLVDVEANADVAAVTSVNEVGNNVVKIKNNNTAYVVKSTNTFKAFVGQNGFNSLKEAISSAVSGQKVILMKDCNENVEFSSILANKKLVIDLNGCALSFERFNLDDENGTQNTTESLTFIDSGVVKGKMICTKSIAVCMGPNDTVILDGVALECSVYGLYPRGNAAKLEVKNSSITATVYAIATNASTTANGGISMLIENSNIETKSSDQDNTGVQINVESSTVIRNSTIKGQRQALMVRGGNALIENSTIEKTGTKAASDYSDYSDVSKDWGQGNMVPAYALVLGNRSTSYQYATYVTLNNVTIIGGIYSWGNSTAGLETTITFGAGNSNTGDFIKGDNVKVNGSI